MGSERPGPPNGSEAMFSQGGLFDLAADGPAKTPFEPKQVVPVGLRGGPEERISRAWVEATSGTPEDDPSGEAPGNELDLQPVEAGHDSEHQSRLRTLERLIRVQLIVVEEARKDWQGAMGATSSEQIEQRARLRKAYDDASTKLDRLHQELKALGGDYQASA